MDQITGYWCVAQTEPNREGTAERWLGQQSFETYLPRIKVPETRRIIPLFPSYLFVRIVDHWYAVSSTIGIIRVLCNGDHPAHVRDDVVDKLKAQERGGLIRLPKPQRLKSGDRVRVVRGNFLGQLGLYEGASGKQRERILLDLLGRKVQVVLPRTDIQPLEVS
jgi:transcription elongation factor/antiterminator RfaH